MKYCFPKQSEREILSGRSSVGVSNRLPFLHQERYLPQPTRWCLQVCCTHQKSQTASLVLLLPYYPSRLDGNVSTGIPPGQRTCLVLFIYFWPWSFVQPKGMGHQPYFFYVYQTLLSCLFCSLRILVAQQHENNSQ